MEGRWGQELVWDTAGRVGPATGTTQQWVEQPRSVILVVAGLAVVADVAVVATYLGFALGERETGEAYLESWAS